MIKLKNIKVVVILEALKLGLLTHSSMSYISMKRAYICSAGLPGLPLAAVFLPLVFFLI
jgi:hypothetical protein